MKKIVFLLFILISAIGFSQEKYTFKTGGNVFDSKNHKLTTDEVRELLASNKQALDLFNSGRSKKTFGNILLYGGLSTLVVQQMIQPKSTSDNVSTPNNALYFVGGAMVLASIPVKIGFSKKIKKAVNTLNTDQPKPKAPAFDSGSLIVNGNGFGISVSF